MAANCVELDNTTLHDTIRNAGMAYEVYPDLRWLDTQVCWFEIALHIKAESYQPPESGESRAAFSLLSEAAEQIAEQFGGGAPVRMTAPYCTIHTPSLDRNQPVGMSRSISIVVDGIPPYGRGEEPRLLQQLRQALNHLGVERRTY
jgi:hypothetical protein